MPRGKKANVATKKPPVRSANVLTGRGLPPYSPELSPVEHVWDELKEEWFANLVFRDFDALEDDLVYALATFEHDKNRTASITSFPWIISINMNATWH